MGPADSGKTYIAGAKWALMEYWAAPEITLVVVSSTDMRGLELRVWGAIKGLFNRAVEKFAFLLGYDPFFFSVVVGGLVACGAVAVWQK